MRRLVLVLFLCILGPAYSQKPPPGKGETAQEPPKQGKDSAAQAQLRDPSVTLSQVSALLEKQEAKHREEQRLAEAPPDWWGRSFNGLLVLVGFGQLYLIWRTNSLSEKAVRAAEKSAEAAFKSIEASEESGKENLSLTRQVADAATESAKTARESLEVTERAYIEIDVVEFGESTLMPKCTLNVAYKNSGRTPCTVVAALVRWEVRDQLPSTLDGARSKAMSVFMANGTTLVEPELIDVPVETVRRIVSGEIKLFVWGFVRYKDAFGKTHQKGFARRWDPPFKSFYILDDPEKWD